MRVALYQSFIAGAALPQTVELGFSLAGELSSFAGIAWQMGKDLDVQGKVWKLTRAMDWPGLFLTVQQLVGADGEKMAATQQPGSWTEDIYLLLCTDLYLLQGGTLVLNPTPTTTPEKIWRHP